jgi:hypothetical protein
LTANAGRLLIALQLIKTWREKDASSVFLRIYLVTVADPA